MPVWQCRDAGTYTGSHLGRWYDPRDPKTPLNVPRGSIPPSSRHISLTAGKTMDKEG